VKKVKKCEASHEADTGWKTDRVHSGTSQTTPKKKKKEGGWGKSSSCLSKPRVSDLGKDWENTEIQKGRGQLLFPTDRKVG